MDIVAKIVGLHEHLASAGIPHGFGGALALAWCTESARGTIDIDVNLFVGADQIDRVLAALPQGVKWKPVDRRRLQTELQHRLWWNTTPLDLFLNSTDYHDRLEERVRWEQFAGTRIPFLSCVDLAVFKVFFDRTKDWADLEAMQSAGTLDVEFVAGVIAHYLGADDSRLARLLTLAAGSTPAS
jgi:hypothetical protein